MHIAGNVSTFEISEKKKKIQFSLLTDEIFFQQKWLNIITHLFWAEIVATSNHVIQLAMEQKCF